VTAILTPGKKFDFQSKRQRPGVDFSGAEIQADEIIGDRGFSSLFAKRATNRPKKCFIIDWLGQKSEYTIVQS
jgi:hypothetical protein